jgi:putative two-component system response regulator
VSALHKTAPQGEQILVLDDEPAIGTLVEQLLGEVGYRVLLADSARAAMDLVSQQRVDLVLSDVVMPGDISGFQLIDALRATRPSLPIVLITGAGTEEHLSAALDHGAAGFITKPFTAHELCEKVSTVLSRSALSELDLRERVLAPTVASVLANAIELRDGGMEGHTERLASLALEIGRLCSLEDADLVALELGAVLHDIGKIGIPDSILLKPGSLTAQEREVIERHTGIGDELLAPLALLEPVRLVVRHHHERWDGNGYPDGLAEEQIPRLARIVAIADSIEAMSGARSYREPRDREQVITELRKGRATQWDPELVDLALELIEADRLRFDSGGMRVLSAL